MTQKHVDKNQKREYDRKYNLLHKDEKKEKRRVYYQNNKEKIRQRSNEYHRGHHKQEYEQDLKQKCGSVERYDEAMQKYDGWCAFACDRKAFLVHHMDGKNIFNSPREEVDNDLSNLLPLCRNCHAWLHKKARDGRNAIRFEKTGQIQ